MPCDMGCQPDWHRDDCAIYLPVEPPAMKDARMTPAEEREIRAAFERDKWAGEWNSLPTAIDRLLATRLTPPGGSDV